MFCPSIHPSSRNALEKAVMTEVKTGTLGLRKPIVCIFPACCARAASVHAAAEPTITLMKSRRRIASPKAGTTPTRTRLQQGFATGGMGFRRQFAQQHSETAHVRFVP